jgi:hypothetical protein
MAKKINKTPEQLDSERRERIAKIGRDTAYRLLKSAIDDSENPEQMANQLAVCETVGVHILATVVFNLVKQKEKSRVAAMGDVIESIYQELTYIEQSNNVQFVEAPVKP